ncbi:MAG: phosphatase PAP2 family protein [Candidatus Aminicenantes bacterium]|nr:phosphatase PAP2 family protein [Candidatus Aminicenantes bacterium]
MVKKIRLKVLKQFICFSVGLTCWLISFFSLYGANLDFSPSKEERTETASTAVSRLGKAYLIQIKEDFVQLLLAPRKWQGPDIMNLAAVFGTGTVIFTLDQDIFNWIAERRTNFSQSLSKIVTKAGDGAWLLGFCGVLYGLGEIGKNPNWRRVALLSVESLAISSMSVAALKCLIGRARPQAWEGSQSFHPFSFSHRHTSFPSGHASAAFSVAASIAGESENRVIDLTAYSLATLVALARVHDEAHWASDVLVGSALGYFIGRAVVNLHRPEKKRFSLRIYPTSQGWAISLSYLSD